MMWELALAMLLMAQTGQHVDSDLRLIAHRGGVVDEQRIENSRSAIEEAIRRGYWMLEVDVRRSRDGVPIAHHDRDFSRYYNDSRRVDEMTADEIVKLRTAGGESPLTLSQYAAICQDRIRVMLDIKVEPDPEFLASVRSILTQHNLLETAWLLGPERTKHFFGDGVLASIGPRELAMAAERGEADLGKRYFLFGIAGQITADDIRLAKQLGVVAAPAVNTFRYDGSNVMQQAQADIQRLRALGVTCFQIDSVYEPFCRGE